jgi:hypothetical protein
MTAPDDHELGPTLILHIPCTAILHLVEMGSEGVVFAVSDTNYHPV